MSKIEVDRETLERWGEDGSQFMDDLLKEHNRAVLQALDNERKGVRANDDTGALWETCFKVVVAKHVRDLLQTAQSGDAFDEATRMLKAAYIDDGKSQTVFMTDDEIAAHFRAVHQRLMPDARELANTCVACVVNAPSGGFSGYDAMSKAMDAAIQKLLNKGGAGAPAGNSGEPCGESRRSQEPEAPPSSATGESIVREWLQSWDATLDADSDAGKDLAARIDKALADKHAFAKTHLDNGTKLANKLTEARATIERLERERDDLCASIQATGEELKCGEAESLEGRAEDVMADLTRLRAVVKASVPIGNTYDAISKMRKRHHDPTNDQFVELSNDRAALLGYFTHLHNARRAALKEAE